MQRSHNDKRMGFWKFVAVMAYALLVTTVIDAIKAASRRARGFLAIPIAIIALGLVLNVNTSNVNAATNPNPTETATNPVCRDGKVIYVNDAHVHPGEQVLSGDNPVCPDPEPASTTTAPATTTPTTQPPATPAPDQGTPAPADTTQAPPATPAPAPAAAPTQNTQPDPTKDQPTTAPAPAKCEDQYTVSEPYVKDGGVYGDVVVTSLCSTVKFGVGSNLTDRDTWDRGRQQQVHLGSTGITQVAGFTGSFTVGPVPAPADDCFKQLDTWTERNGNRHNEHNIHGGTTNCITPPPPPSTPTVAPWTADLTVAVQCPAPANGAHIIGTPSGENIVSTEFAAGTYNNTHNGSGVDQPIDLSLGNLPKGTIVHWTATITGPDGQTVSKGDTVTLDADCMVPPANTSQCVPTPQTPCGLPATGRPLVLWTLYGLGIVALGIMIACIASRRVNAYVMWFIKRTIWEIKHRFASAS